MIKSIVIFVIIQLLTVITSTVKSIATVKSSPTVAGIINAVAYTFNAVVVKLITSQGIYVVLLVTFLSNLIGVPLGKVIMNKLEKERLWVYNATIKNISKNDIKFVFPAPFSPIRMFILLKGIETSRIDL